MAVGQVQLRDWVKVIYRESITGVFIGLILFFVIAIAIPGGKLS